METEAREFDYDLLKAPEREVVQEHTGEIRNLARRAAQDIVEIGQRLTEVKSVLGHGNFSAWLSAEFSWSGSAASKFMQVAEQFKFVNFTNLEVAPSALYALASGSTPETIRQEFIQRAEAGEPIARKDVVARIQEHHQQYQPEPTPFEELPELSEPASMAVMPPKSKAAKPSHTPPAYQGVEEMELGDGKKILVPVLPKTMTRQELEDGKPLEAAQRFQNAAQKAVAALTALDAYSLADLRQIAESPEGASHLAPYYVKRLFELVEHLGAKWSESPQKPTIDQEPLLRPDKTLTLDALN